MMIQMLRPDGKAGISMSETTYTVIKKVFLNALTEETEMTLPDLIALAAFTVSADLGHDIGFKMLHVKSDLLARDLIQENASSDPKKKFLMVSLKTRKKKTGLASRSEAESMNRDRIKAIRETIL
jgi:hypothetical protein